MPPNAMKNDTPITVSRGKQAGWQGYVRHPHANMPGFYWCRVSAAAPFPRANDSKPEAHHKDLVFNADQLATI